MTVYNHMRIGAPDGPVDDINGFGFLLDPENEPGKLKVDLINSTSPGLADCKF